jgi:hypothetical protein
MALDQIAEELQRRIVTVKKKLEEEKAKCKKQEELFVKINNKINEVREAQRGQASLVVVGPAKKGEPQTIYHYCKQCL